MNGRDSKSGQSLDLQGSLAVINEDNFYRKRGNFRMIKNMGFTMVTLKGEDFLSDIGYHIYNVGM